MIAFIRFRDSVFYRMAHFSETTPPFQVEHSRTWVLETYEVHTDTNVLENGTLAKAFAAGKKVTRFQENRG